MSIGAPTADAGTAEPWVPAYAGTAVAEERPDPAGGVRIDGIDLAQPLAAANKATIWRAFLEHHIVVFPGQSLTREEQFAFAAQFGEVESHGTHRGESKPQNRAHVLSNLDAAGKPVFRFSRAANYHWHTDKPYLPAPPMLTMLHAVELPPLRENGHGGDTEFANTALAYATLPDPAKQQIARLRVAFRPAFDPEAPGADHPLVRTHPESGAKALYLGNHATHIVGLSPGESTRLLRELLAHATQRRFVYAHRWRIGDVVMWDNRCLLHRGVLNYAADRYRRILHRSVVRGSVPS